MCDLNIINVDSFNPKMLYTMQTTYQEGYKSEEHKHDFLSIMCILSGSCIYFLDSVPYKVKKGDLIIINPNVRHQRIVQDENIVEEFQAGFDKVEIKNLLFNHLISDDTTPVVNNISSTHEIFNCCSEIISQQSISEQTTKLLLKVLGMKFLAEIIKVIYKDRKTNKKGKMSCESNDKIAIINAVTEFINKNYMHEISLEILSKNMYLSPAYISKIYKEETGESPINYLIKVRLTQAYQTITKNNMTIKEVANSVGYEDAYYFSKLFKKYYGYPPSYKSNNK